MDWQVSPSWRTALTYQRTGNQYASSLHTGESVIDELDSYTMLNWNVRWSMSRYLSFDLAADNLLDERCVNAVGLIAPGRSLWLGFTLGTR